MLIFEREQTLLLASESNSLLNLALFLYGIWNLDFVHYITPPFCVSRNLKLIHIAVLNYISAFYPFFLILLTCIIIKILDHNFRPIAWLWQPFHRFFVKLRRHWDIRMGIIDAFATFLLSFSKLAYQSAGLLNCSRFAIANLTKAVLTDHIMQCDMDISCHQSLMMVMLFWLYLAFYHPC